MQKSLLSSSLLLAAIALAGAGCVVDRRGVAPQGVGGAGPSSSSVAAGGAGSTGTIASAGSGCTPTPEVCDDGIDNDCDTHVDCADQDCTDAAGGFECAPETPGGWTVVMLAEDSAAPCPAGYTNHAVVTTAPAAGGQDCSCSCGAPTTNPCTQGNLSIMFGVNACGGATLTGVATGGCDAFSSTVGFNVSPYATAKANALAPKQVACDATATLPVSPLLGASTCAPAVLSGGGCAGQAACIPRVAAARLCIQHAGDLPCPSGGPAQRSVVAAPADVVDARTCGQCSCTSTATQCAGAKLTGYDDASCTLHAATTDVDGICHFAANSQNFTNNTHFIYSATPNTLACAAASGTTPVGGSFTLNNPITICCP